MTQEHPKTFNLTLTQVVAAALAAVTAAVLGSRLGVAGTVLGAALASVVSTVASAVYQHSLERSRQRMLLVRRHGTAGALGDGARGGEADVLRSGRGEDVESPSSSRHDGTSSRNGSRRRLVVATGAIAAFGLALLAVTGVEAIRGGPLSGGGGTTVGQVLGGPDATVPQRPIEPSGTPAQTSETARPTTTELTTGPSEPAGTTTPPPTPKSTTTSDVPADPTSGNPTTTPSG